MYTTHGHQIPGTPEDDKKPDKVWRCGGVRICSKCYGETRLVNARVAEVLAVLEIEEVPDVKCESALVHHARRELSLLGESDEYIQKYVNVIVAIEALGYDYHLQTLPTFDMLMRYQNLSPLTDDPEEWVFQETSTGKGLWQSLRNNDAFSNDSGKTYWLVSEREIDHSRGPLHNSVHKETNDE